MTPEISVGPTKICCRRTPW